MKELSEKLLVPDSRILNWEPNAVTTKVHIVFGDSIAGSLKEAVKQMGCADTNKVICFRDQYSIGPLWQLHEDAGRAHRGEWFRDNINDGRDYADYYDVTYHQRLTEQISQIPSEASIVIWSGKNVHEQVGLRYAVYLLRKSQNQNEIYVFNVEEACERRFNTADRSIDYLHAGEIPPNKLQSVFGEAEKSGAIGCETRQLLEQEWLSLAEHHEVLRIWDGKRVLNVDEQYFDSYLLEIVEKLHTYRSKNDFIKAARVIGEALGNCDQYIGDNYFEYRLRQLIYNGFLEIKGVPRAMRFYSVRRK
ncbi:hypothetical protein D3C71_1293030 [compost metagenome]